MRVLADLIKDKPDQAALQYAVVEIVAAQAIAIAAYKGEKFTSFEEIKAAIHSLAGYPLLNRFDDSMGSTIGSEAARRVAWLVDVKSDR